MSDYNDPWAPPTEPHRPQQEAWTPHASTTEPPTPPPVPPAPTSASRGGSGLKKWVTVAAVSAIIGAGAGVAAGNTSNDDSDNKPVVTSLNSTSAQALSAPATPSSIRSVLEKVQPAVVSVHVNGEEEAGTGMIVSSDGRILTNAHVVSQARTVAVSLNGKKDTIAAKVLGVDTSIDSAVIKIDGSDLPTVEFGDSSEIQVGDGVVAIGNALALAGGPSVTTGIISAKERDIPNGTQILNNLIQTDAAINPGNSGGPLVNMAGQVIGMNTAVIRGQQGEYQNIGFALSINTIKPAIDDLSSGKVQQQALLGVSAVTLDSSIRERYDLKPESGAVVDSVTRDGPADNAGLTRFDVIVELGGKEVASYEDLIAQVRAHKPDDKVKIVYYRGNEKKETTATLGTKPLG